MSKSKVPSWAREEGDGRRFHVLGRELGVVSRLASQSKRRHDLMLEVPSTERHRVEYRVPAGHEFSRMPSAKRIETPVGRFALDVEAFDGGARVRTELILPKDRIAPADYPAFREFLRRVDESLAQTFEVVPSR